MKTFARIIQFVQRLFAGTRQQRRQARYQLMMQARGIDLRQNSVEDPGLDQTRAEAHGSSGGPGLEVVLDALNISPEDSVLDLGCGKGGAMITMARWTFSRVDGV
jgi:2-polyprenyl-3-methyl-5-hydroxy-6-metoxy-1,4-benzoquinol methylase